MYLKSFHDCAGISKPAQGPDLRKQARDREEQEVSSSSHNHFRHVSLRRICLMQAIAGMRVQAELRGALQLRDLETDRAVLRNEKLKEVEVKIAKQVGSSNQLFGKGWIVC